MEFNLKMPGASARMEYFNMCGNGFGGNSCLWIILILIVLFCCCGNGNGNGCGNDNGCGCGC